MIDLSVLDRHTKIAFQFSGGKDSLACFYLLKRHLDKITVYHIDSGDSFPETREIVDFVRDQSPSFVHISGDSIRVRSRLGLPSDLVPVSATEYGRTLVGHKCIPIVDRYSCCFQSIMLPMHQRMIDDEITLIIRGQKMSDRCKSTIQSGQIIDGFEIYYPINSWTDQLVIEYLAAVEAPIPRFYQFLTNAPDCMTCSAWLEEGRGPYLQKFHPEAYAIYQSRLTQIRNEVSGYYDRLHAEVSP